MNRNKLDQFLKSTPEPERPAAYWDGFSGKVTARLRQPAPVNPQSSTLNFRLPRLAWTLGLATICILLAFAIGYQRGRESTLNPRQLTQAEKYYREIEALFPHQVQAITFDRQGPHLALAEQADVPSSTPYYLKLCGPQGCEDIITFSGQSVRFNGEDYEVLASDQGAILLVGQSRVWSANANQPAAALHIQARPLEKM